MPHILVIDDDSLARSILQRALQGQGYDVVIAASGQEGLDLAKQLRPALIICDWVMPGMSGLSVCQAVKAEPALSTTFFVLLTARGSVEDRIKGLDTGADDYLEKPIDPYELQARVRAGLRLHQLAQDLQVQKQTLETELAEAAVYVRSLLPPPLQGRVAIDMRFIPSQRLGGDCFDYFWLDPDYLAMYVLDVSGHGLGAALLSVALLNLLRSQSLPSVNFYQPQDVLRALNETFQMDSHNSKYFTIWYGVYNQAKRQLTYASGGHPPAVLVFSDAEGGRQIRQFRTPCLPIGLTLDAKFISYRYVLPADSCLYIFSDGVYDFNHNTNPWGFDQFVELLAKQDTTSTLDSILDWVQTLSQVDMFPDDLSLLRVNFD